MWSKAMAILQDVSQDLAALVAKLTAENEALKAKAKSRVPSVTVRVNALGTTRKGADGVVHECKGNIGVYGLGKFPTTLYKAQWLKLFDIVDDIKAAIDNAKPGELADKTSD
jgi:hypothetical protein